MRFVIVAVGLAAAVHARTTCDNNVFESYLTCVNTTVNASPRSARNFELEFRDDLLQHFDQCFTDVQRETGRGAKCYWNDNAMRNSASIDNMIGARGPLARCPLCQRVAKLVVRMIKHSQDAPGSTALACLRKEANWGIGQLMQSCIRERVPNFVVPEIPDFEAHTSMDPELMMNTVALAFSGLAMERRCHNIAHSDTLVGPSSIEVREKCKQEQRRGGGRRGGNNNGDDLLGSRTKRDVKHPNWDEWSETRYDTTSSCLRQRPVGAYTDHCEARKSCIPGQSCRDFFTVEAATCGCAESEADRARRIIKEAVWDFERLALTDTGSASNDADTKYAGCVRIANDIVDTYRNDRGLPVRDMTKRIIGCVGDDNTISRNVRRFLKGADLDKLINFGCNRFKTAGVCKVKEVANAVRLFIDLLETFVMRITRFCGHPNSASQPCQ